MDSTEGSAPAGRSLVRVPKYPGIYRRGEGYVVRFRDMSGRQRQRGNLKTLKEARRVRAELNADVSRGEYRPDTKVSFIEYATAWMDGYRGRSDKGIRQETLAEYRRDLQPAIAYFGRQPLASIGAPQLREYVSQLEAQGFRSTTIRRKLAPVKALFATAVVDGAIRSNPARDVRISAGEKERAEHLEEESVKALTAEELGRLLAEVPEGWQRLMCELLAQTGLRLSEVLGLTWGDVDTAQRRLNVRQRIRGGEAGAPKSRRSRRVVPISSAIARDLQAWRLRTPWSTADRYVFSSETGRARDARNLYRWLKPAAERAGVGWVAFHTLRHTAASRWLHSGVTIAQVSRLLGHHDPGFTLRAYISVMPADLPDGDELAAAVGLSER